MRPAAARDLATGRFSGSLDLIPCLRRHRIRAPHSSPRRLFRLLSPNTKQMLALGALMDLAQGAVVKLQQRLAHRATHFDHEAPSREPITVNN